MILAAMVGTFVLGLGETATDGPSVSFDLAYEAGAVRVTHSGGDSIEAARSIVVVDGASRGSWATRTW